MLVDDPDQINNAADDEKYTAIKKSLNSQLVGRLKKARDPRVLGDGSTFDKPPYVITQARRGK